MSYARLLEQILPALDDAGLLDAVRIAYRAVDDEDYVVLWPARLKTFRVA